MKKIKLAATADFLPLPAPSKKFIPDWYKKIPTAEVRLDAITRKDNKNVKHCIPFLDVLTHGYMATLWQDIDVQKIGSEFAINWSTQPNVLNSREDSFSNFITVPPGFSEVHFVWEVPYIIKTPPGFSVLISHPFNRFDLPFQTLSAIIDADSVMHNGKIPFFLKDDFSGVIKKGTPIFQIIPIKRETWISEEDPGLVKQAAKNVFNSTSVLSGWYKKNIWQKKQFD